MDAQDVSRAREPRMSAHSSMLENTFKLSELENDDAGTTMQE